MSDDEQRIECATHGDAYATYICGHLADNPLQHWFCDYPSADNRWPDAWCPICDEAFQREGEWNEKNDQDVNLKLLCHGCYEDQKGSSVAPLMKAVSGTWQPLLEDAHKELEDKQETLKEKFDLGRHDRWDWDQDTGQIVFSNDGRPALQAAIQFIGSVSTLSETWLWSWANFSLESRMSHKLMTVREFGETSGFANLTVPKWPAVEADGWDMAAISIKILNAQGVYRTPTDTGYLFMLLEDVRLID